MAPGTAICLPVHTHLTQTPEEDMEGESGGHPSGSMVAQTAMVLLHTTTLQSSAHASANSPTHVVTGPNTASGTSVAVPNRLAVERRSLKEKGCSKKVINTIIASRKASTNCIFDSSWKTFVTWSRKNAIDPVKPKIPQILQFLQEGFERGLRSATLRRQLAAISMLWPHVRGAPPSRHPDILRFLKGVKQKQPPVVHRFPSWKLNIVLTALTKHPFEPVRSIQLKWLRMKLLFLVAITSARSVSELRAMSRFLLVKLPSSGLETPATTIEPSSWSGSESPAEDIERMSDSADKPIDNDAEGVWSPDIEQSFQEALAIYPPCGRRKIILSDEGKMYGRNELIARYIKLRTGKTRTRKQVSSHIQVLARRKSRDFHSKLKVTSMDQTAKDKALQHMAAMSSAQIVSATAIHNKLGLPGIPRPTFPGAPGFWPGMIQTGQPGSSQDIKPFVQQAYPIQPTVATPISGFEPASAPAPSVPAWQGRSIGTTKLRLVEFSAFLEQQRDPESYNKHLFVHIGHANHSYSDPLLESVDIRQIYDKFPEKKGGLKELFGKGPQNAFFLVKFWADLNCNIQDDTGAFYGVTSQYESSENMTITCSTKVCSFGKQVVEKVETEYARFENGRFVYRINRSPMCEYMINFIHKLKHLPEKYMMNSVLENFTILLVVTNRDTQETLLCMACVFEVSNSEHGAQHHIYRLVKD
ncbi:transcriptional enhancer factor TEF-1 [Sphaerodactylus townsendi]|nr:transcriptional enhancer factor TEF-1 [Sphaerodactylus townsendi]